MCMLICDLCCFKKNVKMKLLTFHLTDIFFCKNPKFNEFAYDNVYRYICYSHILSIKIWVCQCFVYLTSYFSPLP